MGGAGNAACSCMFWDLPDYSSLNSLNSLISLTVACQLTNACASPWQTCGARAAVVPLWRAAVGNQRWQPLLGCGGSAGVAWLVAVRPCGASGAARVRGPSTRFRGRTIIGLGRPAVVPVQLALPGKRLRFEHLRCWDEPHSDSCVCRARSRPVVWPRARRFVHACHIGRMEH